MRLRRLRIFGMHLKFVRVTKAAAFMGCKCSSARSHFTSKVQRVFSPSIEFFQQPGGRISLAKIRKAWSGERCRFAGRCESEAVNHTSFQTRRVLRTAHPKSGVTRLKHRSL